MIKIENIIIGDNNPLVLIAGPCVIESEDHTLKMVYEIKKIAENVDIPFIFKTSYDKANRTSIDSYRGPGIEKGLEILKKVKKFVPVLSDVHSTEQVKYASDILDIIQIPAFLCRQTDLIVEAAKTGKAINIKKGQFLAPADMKYIIEKIEKTGNKKILLTERGTCFGYNNLVVDMRSLVIMKKFGYPIVFDATHSVQLPGGGKSSSGEKEFVYPLSMSAVAIGIDALFLEVHDNPEKALCDASSMINLKNLEELLFKVKKIDEILKNG